VTDESSVPPPSDPPLLAIQEVEWRLLYVREPLGDSDVTLADAWMYIDRIGRFEAKLGNAFRGRFDVTAERLMGRDVGSTLALYPGVKGFLDKAGGRLLRSSPRWSVEGEEATLLDEATGTALLMVAGGRRPGVRVL